MTTSGQLAKKGVYRCVNCGRMQAVQNVKKSLNPCPTCQDTRFTP